MKKILTILMIFVMCFSFVSADNHDADEEVSVTTTNLETTDSSDADVLTEAEEESEEPATEDSTADSEETEVETESDDSDSEETESEGENESAESEEELLAELEEDEDEADAKAKLAEVRQEVMNRCQEARESVELSEEQMNALEEAENRMQYIRDQHASLKAEIASCIEENDKETCKEQFAEEVEEFKKLTKSERVEVKCKALSSRVAAHLKNAWYGFDEEQKSRFLETADSVMAGNVKVNELKSKLKDELRKTKEAREEKRKEKVERFDKRLAELERKYPDSEKLEELRKRVAAAREDPAKIEDLKAATKARAVKKVQEARELAKERMKERKEVAGEQERKLLKEAEKHQERMMEQTKKEVKAMDGKKVDDLMKMPGADRFMEGLDPESKKALEMARNENVDTSDITEAIE